MVPSKIKKAPEIIRGFLYSFKNRLTFPVQTPLLSRSAVIWVKERSSGTKTIDNVQCTIDN